MPRIGLRHLKTHASEVLRDVEDHRARYVVTNRGEPVAVIIPYAPADELEPRSPAQAWNRLLDLRKRVSAANQRPFSVEDLMRELRR
jgi:prevent-host-death family protein